MLANIVGTFYNSTDHAHDICRATLMHLLLQAKVPISTSIPYNQHFLTIQESLSNMKQTLVQMETDHFVS